MDPQQIDRGADAPPPALHARAGTPLNPVTAAVVPLEMALTNAQRLARGLTPNKPHFRRQAGVCMRCRLCRLG